jgi:uncharacterized RDD family membrane protein YckC
MFCSKCGANVAEGVAFCSACGQPVVGYSVAPAGATPPAATPAYVPPAQTGWQAPTARAPVAYAGFWLRVVAFIIDAIVLGVVGAIITFPIVGSMDFRGMLMGHMGHQPMSPDELIPFFGMFFKLALIRIILNWLYFALLESSAWQGTLGKKALGLEVTDLAGNRINFGRATGRFFGKIISALILWIGFIMAGFTEKKQALHDIMAGTLVIRRL